ncbi:MAG TPA: ATP-binding cassette domain-containing protein [Caulobacteraceae bacterium]|jgi:cell division transport system ATP-binding protein|nr:ATP-binding cassette domain-containing protein [Caulobacteraceae bacterium]
MSRTADAGPPLSESIEPLARDNGPVVRFEAVGLGYGGGPEILKNMSFELEPGSFHFITGASGAGKTTLLRLIQMVLHPTRGAITLFGRDTRSLRRAELPLLRRRIGMVFHDRRLLDHLDVFDNAALPLRLAGGRLSDYQADVAELLAWVGLGERMNATPPRLSGGEQQRLAIARAVVGRPDLLIADEPTGDVDHEMAIRILRLFVELNRLGATVLIATHDDELAARSGRPVMHIEGGMLRRISSRGAVA